MCILTSTFDAGRYVRDARALLVYGAVAGCTFGCIENLGYAFLVAPFVSVFRALLTVPLHTATGLQIGCSLAEARFRDGGAYHAAAPKRGLGARCAVAARLYAGSVWGPVLAHGSYNAFLFVANGECGALRALIAGAYVGVVPFFLYVRSRVVAVEAEFPPDVGGVDIHALIERGDVERPCRQCACCACCY